MNYKNKLKLYKLKENWRKYDFIVAFIGVWVLFLTLIALEARGVIT